MKLRRVRPGKALSGFRSDFRIAVEGLSEATSWEDLKDFFSQGYNQLCDAKIGLQTCDCSLSSVITIMYILRTFAFLLSRRLQNN